MGCGWQLAEPAASSLSGYFTQVACDRRIHVRSSLHAQSGTTITTTTLLRSSNKLGEPVSSVLSFEWILATHHHLRLRKIRYGTASYRRHHSGSSSGCHAFELLMKYNVNVVTHTLRLDFKYVDAEESRICQTTCSPASDKKLTNSLQDAHMTFQGTPWCSAVAEATFLSHRAYEKDSQKGNVYNEAGHTQESKRRHNYRECLDPVKLDWLKWLFQNWKWYFAVNRISDLKNPHNGITKNQQKPFTQGDRWKANWWTTSW